MSEEIPVKDLLNAQAGRIGWDELARHFARGVVVCVAKGEDMLRAAELMVANQAEEIEQWSQRGTLWRATDDDARRWQQAGGEFWTVVVAPWVIVQEAEL